MKSIDNKKAHDLGGQGLIDCHTVKETNMTSLSLHQNQLALNHRPLVIANFTIRQDDNGRYCINDLHKASGGAEKHKPFNFMRNQQTKDLVIEIEQENMMLESEHHKIAAVNTIKGRGLNQGTFVVKELVYFYAMWISAKFHLIVIRAYDALVSGQFQNGCPKTHKSERTALHDAHSLLVTKTKHLNSSEAWRLINQRFGTESIEQIPYDAIPVAVEYVHHLIAMYSATEKKQVAEPWHDSNVQHLMYYIPKLHKYIANEIYPALTAIQSNFAGNLHGFSQDVVVYANTLNRLALESGMTHLNHFGNMPVHRLEWYLKA